MVKVEWTDFAREKGIEKGREEEKIAIIHKCFELGLPIENIILLTGFSKEQIIQYNTKNSL
jgi:predicted transposase/invertase (TIGR01784 family)